MVSIDKLGRIFPKVSGEILDVVGTAIHNASLDAPVAVTALFCGQLYVESVGLTHTKEIGEGYTRDKETGMLVKPKYWPWFGRGYIQLTWRDNYAACAKATGLDCVSHPEVLEDPEGAIASAIWFYTSHGLHNLRDCDTISRRINGAGAKPESLAARRYQYERCLKILLDDAGK
jgi:putative chitinase